MIAIGEIRPGSATVTVNVTQQIFVTGATGYVGTRVIPALLARGHRVIALARAGSEARVPRGCDLVIADPLDGHAFAHRVVGCDTLLQLVGVAHPSPSKADLFRSVDLQSGLASITAAQSAGIRHFVYVSVAHPAPVMRAYQAVRMEVERTLAATGLRRTIVRPWYMLGPGHRWPYALVPAYWMLERLPATRDSARRLGLVTIETFVNALIHAIENPPAGDERIVEVPQIRSSAVPGAIGHFA